MNAILLAGGKSTRFKTNKALANYKGETFIEHLAKLLDKHFEDVYIVVDDQEKYKFLEHYKIVEDIIPNKGPLGGIYTGLIYSDTTYNYVTAVDMPLISNQYLEFIQTWDQDYDVLVPEYHHMIEPLAGIYSKNCLNALKEHIDHDNLSVTKFIKEINATIISDKLLKETLDNDNIFHNVNTKDDLKQL